MKTRLLLAFVCSAFLPAVHAAENCKKQPTELCKKLLSYIRDMRALCAQKELRHLCEKAKLRKQLKREKQKTGAACALVRTLEERAEFAEAKFIAAQKHDNANLLAICHRALEREKAAEEHNKTVFSQEIILSMEEDPDKVEIKRLQAALAAAQKENINIIAATSETIS